MPQIENKWATNKRLQNLVSLGVQQITAFDENKIIQISLNAALSLQIVPCPAGRDITIDGHTIDAGLPGEFLIKKTSATGKTDDRNIRKFLL